QATQAATLRDHLARAKHQRKRFAAEIAGEPEKIRQEHSGCCSDESAVTAQLQAAREGLRRNEGEIDRLATERPEFAGQVVQFEADLRTEEAKRAQWRQALEMSKAALPLSWAPHAERTKLSDMHVWTAEREELVARDTEKRANELRQARSDINALRQRRADLDHDSESIPEEARRPADELRDAVQ